MDVREKLVELMCDVLEDGCIGHCNHPPCWKVTHAVDGLIANGVTVQGDKDINVPSKWIFAKKMLPEYGVPVLVYVYMNGEVLKATRRGNKWYSTWDNTTEIVYVSHWMPLPQPPKGE